MNDVSPQSNFPYLLISDTRHMHDDSLSFSPEAQCPRRKGCWKPLNKTYLVGNVTLTSPIFCLLTFADLGDQPVTKNKNAFGNKRKTPVGAAPSIYMLGKRK